MRGYGMTAAALCAGAASGFLAAYLYCTKKKSAALASAALDQPEAAPSGLKNKQKEVASDRPSSPSFQLRALPSQFSSAQQAGVEDVSTSADSIESSDAEQQVAGAILQHLSQHQHSVSPSPAAAPPPLAWRGSWHPILSHNLPQETEQTVIVQGVKYLKLEELGSGGSSQVHKVVNSRNQVCALKRVQLAGLDAAVASAFITEETFLRELQQEPSVIDFVASEVVWPRGVMYLVQECADTDLEFLVEERNAARRAAASNGNAQDDLLTNLSADDEHWIRLTWQGMLEAVCAIHQQQIIHRDLKPANFALVGGHVKMIDFGLAKKLPTDGETVTCLEAGTTAYMAPETIRSRRSSPYVKIGKPSDVWSLGCMLYELVYGRRPYAHLATKDDMKHAIRSCTHEVVFPPLANSHLRHAIERCLDKNPDTRITVQELLAHPFLHQGQHQGPGSAVTLGASSGGLKTGYLAQQLQLLCAALRC